MAGGAMVDRKAIARSGYRLPAGARHLRRLAADSPIIVSVYLRDRETGAGRTTRADLAARRAADHADDIRLFRAFAAAQGLDMPMADPARRLIKLSGPASAMETAFATELHQYHHPDGDFRARLGALSLPSGLAGRVQAVLGLEDRQVARVRPSVPAADDAPQGAAGAPVGYLPTEFSGFYDFPPAYTGAGQSIALLEFGGGYSADDLQTAAQAMGIAPPVVLPIHVDGADNSPGSPHDLEVALDLQIAMGAAPGARLLVYFSAGTEMGMVDAVSAAAHDQTNQPTVISLSWGSAESRWSLDALTAMDQACADAARLGVTVICSSGDKLAGAGGADGGVHVGFPSSSPHVLACGGTRVTVAQGRITGEVVWNGNGQGTGGGISADFPVPDYQRDIAIPVSLATGRPGRAVPDVAANADPATGYRIHRNGRWELAGGTSASTPLWAGLVARANQARAAQTPPRPALGFFNAALYGAPGVLAPVTQGDNFIPGTSLGYRAGPGYNCCTGLGTPATAALFPFLVGV